MLKFYKENHSLTVLLLSTIFTAVIAVPSLVSLLIHIVNFCVLFTMRMFARSGGNDKFVYVLLFVSLGLTALVSIPDVFTVVMYVINMIMLFGIIWTASMERKV